MALGIDPNADKTPLIPEGTYGHDGEAQLVRLCAQSVPKSDPTTYYVDFNVKVAQGTGVQFVSGNAFGRHNTQIGANSGSVVRTFLTQLGLNPDKVQFAEEPDDVEAKVPRHSIIGDDPTPMDVIVEVGVETWKDRSTGQERSRNVIKNIWARG